MCVSKQPDMAKHVTHSSELTAGMIALSRDDRYPIFQSLHTKQFCMQLTKAYEVETSCNQLLFDTAT